MKGDTNWIVWLLVVVVAAGIILYLMWSKGIGPFNRSLSEAECRTLAYQVCSKCLTTGSCKDALDDFLDKHKGCAESLGWSTTFSGEPSAVDACQELMKAQ